MIRKTPDQQSVSIEVPDPPGADAEPNPERYFEVADEIDAKAERYATYAKALRKLAGDTRALGGSLKEIVARAHAGKNLEPGRSTGNRNLGNVDSDMTRKQLKHRGHAVSSSRARRSGDPRRLAIVESEWKAPRHWATKRAKISPSSMTNYLSGKTAIPDHIARLFHEDFKGFKIDDKVFDFAPGPETWPVKKRVEK